MTKLSNQPEGIQDNSCSLHAVGLLVFRVSVAGMMLMAHGWGKLTSFNENMHNFPDPLGVGAPLSMALAIFAEFFCSLAVVLGLFTRLAVLPLIVTMAVAAFIVHAADPWAKQELATLYLVCFVTILFVGPGRYSVDRIAFNRGSAKEVAEA